MYYSNRILKELKDKCVRLPPNTPDDRLLIRIFRDIRHAEWVRAFVTVMDEMKRYVLENHPTGLVWNASVSYAPFHVHQDSESGYRESHFQSINPLHL